MINKLLACCVALGLLAGAGSAFAAEPEQKTKYEIKEVTGVVEIVKADAKKKEKYDTVLLKEGEKTYKLIPAKDKKLFKELEALGGRKVTVIGTLLPANPPRYPLAALKVESFAEVKAPEKK
jgi:hypothetical protein